MSNMNTNNFSKDFNSQDEIAAMKLEYERRLKYLQMEEISEEEGSLESSPSQVVKYSADQSGVQEGHDSLI